jgi:hypothetical protein
VISDRTNLAKIYAPSCENYYDHAPKGTSKEYRGDF